MPVPSPVADLEALPELLAGAGVRGLVLRPARTAGDRRRQFRPMQVLVRGSSRRAALGALDHLAWRAAWVPGGRLRLLPGTAFWWDDGTFLELYWALPAAPMPPLALRRLERELWDTAPGGDALVTPDPAALLVHLAVQSLRVGRGRDAAWTDFGELRERADLVAARSLAWRAGLSRGLARCLAAADSARPPFGPPYDGPRRLAWAVASALQSRARPRWLRRLLAGSPAFGDAALRFRTSGIEVRSGPGVFVPSASVDLLISVARDRLARFGERPVVVEVGTGCGPVAIALAAEHPGADVHATDLSAAPVRSAAANARTLGLGRLQVHRGSLLDALPDATAGRVDLIVANLPYIPIGKGLAIGSVPGSTILGHGEDGLALHRALLRRAASFVRPGGVLVLQMLASQWEGFAGELAAAGYRPEVAAAAGSFVIGAAVRGAGPSVAGLD